jgi:hypothetical protein
LPRFSIYLSAISNKNPKSNETHKYERGLNERKEFHPENLFKDKKFFVARE